MSPEKAEVYVTAQGLNEHLKYLSQFGMQSIALEIFNQKIVKQDRDDSFKILKQIECPRFITHGKWIFFNSAPVGKFEWDFIFHLGMSAALICRQEGIKAPNSKYHLASLKITTNNDKIHYIDFVNPRGAYSAQLYVYADKIENFLKAKKIGPDFYFQCDAESFVEIIQRKASKCPTKSIKEILLDQSVTAGIGNYLASEGLFDAGLHPLSSGRILSRSSSEKKLILLYHSIRNLITCVIELKGMSTQHYVNSTGERGEGKNLLKVYGREGMECFKCSSKILNIPINNRSTFFCRNCQQHSLEE